MNVTYSNTPGVKIREVATLPPSVVQVSTAIPAFLGFTERGPKNEGKRITSLKEYEDNFGGPWKISGSLSDTPPTGLGSYFLHEALRAYFLNGGGPCYVISVGKLSDPITTKVFTDGLEELERHDEPTLICCPEATSLNSKAYGTVASAMRQQCANLQDRFALLDTPKGIDATQTATLEAYRTDLGDNDLTYGASYFPHLATVMTYAFDPANTSYNGETLADLAGGDANYQVALNLINSWPVVLPPSVLVAGVCAKVDQERGVWNAPANVSLTGVTKPVTGVSDAQQALLNVDPTSGKSINAIRTFSGRGTLVWGARTLAGNSNEWRYIPVRRLFITVEESVAKACNQFVFAGNDATTWVNVSSMISSYLQGLWQEGGLQGATPEEAFFVRVGLGTTMTEQDILEGRMNVEVGLAAVRPAEFIILTFSHKVGE